MPTTLKYAVVEMHDDPDTKDGVVVILNLGAQAGVDPVPVTLRTSSDALKSAIGTVGVGAEIDMTVTQSPFTAQELDDISRLTPM